MKHSNCSAERTDEQAIAVARYQHWADLATTATRLLDPPVNHSRIFADCDWNRDDADEYLSQCLAAHLEVEFPSVSWPREFDGWTRADAKFREIFRLVSRHHTFIGTCPICDGWQETEDPPPAQLKTLDVVQQFLDAKVGKVADTSITGYRHTLGIFVKYCLLLPSTPEELDRYLARFRERRTAAGAYTVIKMLYKFANERFDFPNVISKVQRPAFQEKAPFAFNLQEARRILDEASKGGERNLALVHLYLGHGFREREAVKINIGDYADGQIMVRGKKRTEPIPLLPETRQLLLRLENGRKPGSPLFLSQMGQRLSAKMAYVIVKDILRSAGVLEGRPIDARIATHALRKTFATLMRTNGCPRDISNRLLRDYRKEASDRYYAEIEGMMKEALERYSPLRLVNAPPPQKLDKIFSCST